MSHDSPEATPLLAPSGAPRPRFSAARWQVQSPRAVILLVGTVKFSVVCTGMLLMIPFFRLVEDALCHAHYDDESPGFIEERRCKVDEVQSRLAFLNGSMSLLTAVISELGFDLQGR